MYLSVICVCNEVEDRQDGLIPRTGVTDSWRATMSVLEAEPWTSGRAIGA